jgi:hypothetical protein
VSNSHVPFQLGYVPINIRKNQEAPTFVGASEIESELGNLTNDQTNPEGRARLTRRLIMDLICIVIFKVSIARCSRRFSSLTVKSGPSRNLSAFRELAVPSQSWPP